MFVFGIRKRWLSYDSYLKCNRKKVYTSEGLIPILKAHLASNNKYGLKLSTGLIFQSVRISGNQGSGFGTVNFPIPFSDINYHVYAQSQDPDENLTFQIANVSFLNKTTTSCRVAHKLIEDQNFVAGTCNGGYIDVLAIGV